MNRIEELRGPITWYYTDMFGMDFPIFGDSKLVYISNIGKNRKDCLKWLKENNIEILRNESIFRWILVAPTDDQIPALKEKFGRDLKWDKYL